MNGSEHSYAVEARHLSRKYRGKIALDDVSLQIPVGCIFGLIGLNGAGKTTLIRHLIGMLRPKHGHVTILGKEPILAQHDVLKRVGYMTEEDSLPKWMRVGELLDFSRPFYPTWDDAYANRLLDQFGLSRSSKLNSLSKGQRARTGLLVAIAHRPELLILDEPSSGLDPIARSDILEAVIRTISEDGRTVLFSSHLLDEVDRACDTVALMKEGKIIDSITTEQMETRYYEAICRSNDKCPSDDPGFLGWQRQGDEWSAVVDTSVINQNEVELASQIGLVEKREITLQRWFAAKAGCESVPAGRLVEAPSHV